MTTAHEIRSALERARMSQAELARLTGMTADKLSRSLSGNRRFQLEEIERIRAALDMNRAGGPEMETVDGLAARYEFAERLKYSRERKGLTLERAARGIIDRERLRLLEEGAFEPSVLELDLLAERLAVSLDWLVSGKSDDSYSALDAQENRAREVPKPLAKAPDRGRAKSALHESKPDDDYTT